MATEAAPAAPSFELDSSDWSRVLEAIKAADTWLACIIPGDKRADVVVGALTALAEHSKWEVRRAVASLAGQHRHRAFDAALATLRIDDNTRVRQAADAATTRRRDWVSASAFGRQHEDHINAALDGIEVRFGPAGRKAVKRASEHIADTFARELYHEVIKRVSPLVTAAERLRQHLGATLGTSEEVVGQVVLLEGRIRDLHAMLDGMRAYTLQPRLLFSAESMLELVIEAAALVRDSHTKDVPVLPAIEVRVGDDVHAEVSRPRILQALTNLIHNAIESYAGRDTRHPVVVTVVPSDGSVEVQIRDGGCGMSAEALGDASSLFVTSKPNGTGFGLPLAIKIIESEHEGRFRLESTEGRGTTAFVLLPTKAPQGST